MAILSLPSVKRPKNQFDQTQFDNNGDPISDIPSIKPPSNSIDDFLAQLDEMAKPTKGMGDYQTHLKSLPQRSNYELGTGKNILAILAGALTGAASSDPSKGIAQIESIKNRPYDTAMQDWEMKGKGLKTEADLERENLSSQRGLIGAKAGLLENQASNEFRNTNAAREQSNTDRAFTAGQANKVIEQGFEGRKVGAEEKSATANMTRANADAYKAQHPQSRIIRVGDTLVDKDTGEVVHKLEAQPTVDMKNRDYQAHKIIDKGDEIKQQLDDSSSQIVGPLVGRAMKLGIDVGDLPGVDPKVLARAARLQTDLKSYAALHAKLHGGRMSAEGQKMMENMIGGLERGSNLLGASIDGLNDTARIFTLDHKDDKTGDPTSKSVNSHKGKTAEQLYNETMGGQ